MIQSKLTSPQHLVDCANIYYKEHPNGIGFISVLHDNYDNVDKAMLKGLSTDGTEELNDLLKQLFPKEAQLYSIVWSDQYNGYRLLLKAGEPVQPPHPAQAVKPIISSIDALLDIAHKWYTSNSTQPFTYYIRDNYTTPVFDLLESGIINEVQVAHVADALFADACDFDFKQEGLRFVKIPKVGKAAELASVSEPALKSNKTRGAILNISHLVLLANQYITHPWNDNTNSTEEFSKFLEFTFVNYPKLVWPSSKMLDFIKCIANTMFEQEFKNTNIKWDDTKYSKGKLMVEFVEPVASIADTQFNMVVTQTTTRTVELSKDEIQDILSHAVFGASEEINEIIKVELHYDKNNGFSATVIGTSQKKV